MFIKENIFPLILLFAFVFVGLPVILRLLSGHTGQSGSARLPYHTKYILTGPEYKFYLALRPVMETQSRIICPKVGLKDLFEVNAGTKERRKYFGHISQKHVDFLICDADLRPLFAIELDDKSHNRADVKEKDAQKDAIFQSAGLPLYRIPTASSYSEEYIRSYITT